ncbi:MAG: hypothetical protein WDN69_09490 [Aliidongia sp.]
MIGGFRRKLMSRIAAFMLGLCLAYAAQAGDGAEPSADAWVSAPAHALTDLDAFGTAIGQWWRSPRVAMATSRV